MQVKTNQEDKIFRCSLDFSTNEAMGHKLLTENKELIDSIKQDIDEAGRKILVKLNYEFDYRFRGK